MSRSARVVRGVVAAAVGIGVPLVLPAWAAAAPIDLQPTPLLCSAGLGDVESQVATDNPALKDGQVFYFIRDADGTGAQVAHLNLATGATGTQAFVNAPADTPWIGALPIALAEAGAGPVVSAVYGMHTNTEGQMCLLLPGLDLAQVPAATAPATEN